MSDPTPQATTSAPAVPHFPAGWELVKRAGALYRERWETYALIVAAPLVAAIVSSLLPSHGAAAAIGGLITIVYALLLILASPALIIVRRDGVGAAPALKRSLKLFWAYLWLSILVGFIVLGGSGLFVIPGILLAISLTFGVYVLVFENLRGMQAVLKSRFYVSGYRGKVLWRLLVLGLITLLVELVPEVLIGLLGLPHIAATVYDTVVSLALLPFSILYLTLIYEELRGRKDESTFTGEGRGKLLAIGFIGLAVMIAVGILLAVMVAHSAHQFPLPATTSY